MSRHHPNFVSSSSPPFFCTKNLLIGGLLLVLLGGALGWMRLAWTGASSEDVLGAIKGARLPLAPLIVPPAPRFYQDTSVAGSSTLLAAPPIRESFAMGSWPSATALQFCGAPGILRHAEPSGYNDWTVVRAHLNDPPERWVREMSVYGDSPFWGYINWQDPEDGGAFPNLYRDAGVIDVLGGSGTDSSTGNPKGMVCSLRPVMQEYILSSSRVYRERGLHGLFMDMAWVGWNGCPYNYDEETMAAFKTWLAARRTPEELRALGISNLNTFDLRAHALSLDAGPNTRAKIHDPIIFQYALFQTLEERRFLENYVAEMDAQTPEGSLLWSFTLNRPNASMFLVLDLLETVRHETFIGGRIARGHLARPLSEQERRYPDRNMIFEFRLFADQGKRLWSSNSPVFTKTQVWKDNLLFMAETYAAGGIGHFPTTDVVSEWGQSCPLRRSEAPWVAAMDTMLEPVLKQVSAYPSLYGLETDADVGFLYPLDSNLYSNLYVPAETIGFTDQEQSLGKDQDEAIVGAALLLQDLHIPYRVIPFASMEHFQGRYPLTLERIQAYPVLAMPAAIILSDEDISVLQTYVAQGGRLLTSYKAGTHNEQYTDVFPTRTDWNALVHTRNPKVTSYGRGFFWSLGTAPLVQRYYFYTDERAALRTLVTDLAPELRDYAVQTSLPPTMNLLSYRAPDASRVIHLLNYNYTRARDTFVRPGASTLTFPLPTDYIGDLSVEFVAPNFLPTPLSYDIVNNAVTVSLPDFEYYGVLKIGSRIQGGASAMR